MLVDLSACYDIFFYVIKHYRILMVIVNPAIIRQGFFFDVSAAATPTQMQRS